jgi:hypothetical protein
MPGARCTRSRAWCVVNTRVSHHGYTGSPGIPARNGFNGFLRALLGDRAFLSPSSAYIGVSSPFGPTSPSANLTPASGRQDHTTSPSALAPFVKGAITSTASLPASVTIAIRPCMGRDGEGCKFDLGWRRNRIFLQKGLDTKIGKLPVGQIRCHSYWLLWSQSE